MSAKDDPQELEVWLIDLDASAAVIATVAGQNGLDRPCLAGRPDERRETAHRALRLLLARHAGVSAAALPFQILPSGKPVLDGALGREIFFSLAHSGQNALVAISTYGPVGVDIERDRSLSMSPARRLAIEQASIVLASGRELVAPDGDARTLQAWVRLEAAAKATGEGIGRLLERLGARPGRVVSSRAEVSGGPMASVQDLRSPEGLTGAVGWLGDALVQADLVVRHLPQEACQLSALLTKGSA